MFQIRSTLAAALIGFAAVGAQAGDENPNPNTNVNSSSSDEIRALKEQISSLDQKVRVLERKDEITAEENEKKIKESPIVSVGEKGFQLQSADKNFSLRFGALVQADSRWFVDDGPAASGSNDTFLLRRVRPTLQGTVFKNFEFKITPDFAPASTELLDAYLNVNYVPWLQVQAGKFKQPLGIERLQSAANTEFIERALPTNLVPTRDIGVALHGEVFDGIVDYTAGIFNGAQNGERPPFDVDDDKTFAGRLFLQPFKTTQTAALQGLGFGAGASYGSEGDDSLNGAFPGVLRSGGQRTFFTLRNTTTTGALNYVRADGDHLRVNPQLTYYYGPFGLIAEYVLDRQDVRKTSTATTAGNGQTLTLDNEAWAVSLSYVLTGEDASYKGVIPKHPFNPLEGEWGAFEVVARYNELQVDHDAFRRFGTAAASSFADPTVSASRAAALGAGLNWYLNRNIKAAINYEFTDFEGGDQNGLINHSEHAVLTRLQLNF